MESSPTVKGAVELTHVMGDSWMVTSVLLWRAQDVDDDRALGCVPERATGREWNQS